MASRNWYSGLVAAAAFSALLASPAFAQIATFSVQIAPPAPRVEVVPTARPGEVWVPGHWKWNGSQHVWIAGHFQQRRAGFVYAPARWIQVGGHWEYREGAWVQPSACRDTDRDGICNRLDRDKDGDGIANRADPNPGRPNATGPVAVYVETPPPPPRVEPRPVARQGQMWVPGHWRWSGNQYDWIPGHYRARRAGLIFVPERWVQVNGRWQFEQGQWVSPGPRFRDTDGDGVADRFDNDRDGDGTPNRYDARPGNQNVR
jgi:hypothetical protein